MAGPWEEWVKVRLSIWASGAGAVSRASLFGARGRVRYTSRDFSEGSVRTRKYSSLPGGDSTRVFPLARESSDPDNLSVHVKHQVALFTRN